MPWGQVIAGPPGSGKTTYCGTMLEALRNSGRKSIAVNIDFANDKVPYDCAVDVADLISLTDVMDAYELGPNGGLMYCMEYLNENFDWLEDRLGPYLDEGYYILIDSPGQAELYTHSRTMASILEKLQKLDLRLAAVHLIDSHHCSDPFKFVSGALVSLQAMIRLELPHVNVLTKVDLEDVFRGYDNGVDSFTEDLDLNSLLPFVEDLYEDNNKETEVVIPGKVKPRFPEHTKTFMKRFLKLNERLIDVINDYNLVSFVPISMKDPKSYLKLLTEVDKANGFVRPSE